MQLIAGKLVGALGRRVECPVLGAPQERGLKEGPRLGKQCGSGSVP